MGGHGVELFFMISGFLIPASLVRHASVGKFFYDRALRILPVFVVLHLVLFVAGPGPLAHAIGILNPFRGMLLVLDPLGAQPRLNYESVPAWP